MMLTEQVLAQATLLTGNLEDKQRELLRILCAAATSGLKSRLKDGLTVEDCRSEFVTAASLFALAALQATGQEEAEEFRAGDLTVRRSGTDTSSRCLQRQAELIIQPFLKDGFVFLGV